MAEKELEGAAGAFNARAETVATKPMFRDAFGRRRCIIPASGFYKWTGPKLDRIPHYFSAADGSPLIAFAGLWDKWRDPDTGKDVLSATIIVTGASRRMTAYHDRQPVILRPHDFDRWLTGEMGADELRPAAEEL